MIGVVDVGGGLRDVFGAGIFDKCIEDEVNFDYCLGVSAGSANIASYAANQKGRNYRFYNEYSFRREYMSMWNLFHNGCFLNLDYVYGTLSNNDGEYPLDYQSLIKYNGTIKTVATNGITGEAKYFNKNDYKQDDFEVIKASCTLPIACKPCVINGIPYFDGGISDPIPIEKAFSDGCEKIVLILTKPLIMEAKSLRNSFIAKLLENKYPAVAEKLSLMHQKYLDTLQTALNYQKKGKILIVAPDDTCGMKTLTRDKEKIFKMYYKGYNEAKKIKEFVNA